MSCVNAQSGETVCILKLIIVTFCTSDIEYSKQHDYSLVTEDDTADYELCAHQETS